MKPQSFNQQLRSLRQWQQVAFCSAIAERMFPNYALFAEVTGFGSAKVVRDALNTLWEGLMVKHAKINYENQLDKVEAQIPEPERFDMYGVYPALDATVALCTALNCALHDSPDEVVSVSKLSRDTVTFFIQASEAPELEGKALADYAREHVLMQQERTFQAELLARLCDARQPSPPLIKSIRQLAANDGISNIGISLE